MRSVRNIAFAFSLFTFAGLGGAHTLSLRECAEMGEFLKHAAMSRDNGMSRDEFLGRVRDDIVLIQAYPADLRWIVQDTKDETMMVGAVETIFDAPSAPEQHEAEFLQTCERRFADQVQ